MPSQEVYLRVKRLLVCSWLMQLDEIISLLVKKESSHPHHEVEQNSQGHI